MDKATIGGLILAWVSLIGSVVIEKMEAAAAGHGGGGGGGGASLIEEFVKIGPAVLVFGGTLGATAIGFSMKEIMELPAKIKLAFNRKAQDLEALLKQILDFATRARRDGILALENDIDGLEDPFMKKGFQLAVDGADLDNIREILEQDIAKRKLWFKEGEEFFKQLGGFAPTLGIIGTVLGLISMLANLENASSMGPAIAAAFIATLYGVSSANLVFLPIGNKIKNVGAQDLLEKRVILEGVVSIQSGASIRITESRLQSLIGEHEGHKTEKKK